MDFHEPGLTALRASAIYVVLLVVLRVLGKRTVGHATAFDFMIALILGEVVDEPIYGDVPLAQAFVAIGVIAAWHYVNSWLSYRSERFDHLAGGSPTLLVKDGKMVARGMRSERVNRAELMSMLRLNGIDRLEDVREASLEPDGMLSVIKTDAAQEARKEDLDRVLGTAA